MNAHLPPEDAITGFHAGLLPPDGSLGRARTYEKGSFLWPENDQRRSVFVVKRGEVDIFVPGLKETPVRTIKSGELCGLDRLYGEPHTQARANVHTIAVEIPRDDFVAFLTRTPRAMLAALFTACDRLRFAEERAHMFSYHSAERRMLALLHQLTDRNGHPSRDNPELKRLQCTHAELARLAGLNRPHTSVIMGRLRKNGIVQYRRGTPVFVNVCLLETHLGLTGASQRTHPSASGAAAECG